MNKQQQQIKIGVYFFNGAYRPFQGYPKSVDVWNSSMRYEADYLGSPSSTGLTGVAKANPSGYRPMINLMLDNSRGSQAEVLRQILNRLGNQFDRQVYPETGVKAIGNVNTTTNTFTITDADLPIATNFYVQTVVDNETRGQTYPVSNYTFSATVGTFTVTGNTSNWANSDQVRVYARPNLPSYIGVSVDDTNVNVVHCTLESSILGVARELTIGNHIVNLSLRGRERVNSVPQNIII